MGAGASQGRKAPCVRLAEPTGMSRVWFVAPLLEKQDDYYSTVGSGYCHKVFGGFALTLCRSPATRPGLLPCPALGQSRSLGKPFPGGHSPLLGLGACVRDVQLPGSRVPGEGELHTWVTEYGDALAHHVRDPPGGLALGLDAWVLEAAFSTCCHVARMRQMGAGGTPDGSFL